MNLEAILRELKNASNPADLEGMARVGITPDKAFGTKIPVLRTLAKKIGKDHDLALELWRAGFRETQILAAMVDEPQKVTVEQVDRWAEGFGYWEICDQCCMNLFYLLPFAKQRAIAWTQKSAEQQKRAGFALIAVLAWKKKEAEDGWFMDFFPCIEQGAVDERAPVKKAVSWALRNIGKRNSFLNQKACELAELLDRPGSKPARWVSRDALKELKSKTLRKRL